MTSPSASGARRPRSPRIEVPFLTPQTIAARADDIRRRYHPTGGLPVPAELMIEQAGIDLIELEGLRKQTGLEACAGPDGKSIYYDPYNAERYPARFRFSLAHEWGHIELHASLPWYADFRPESIHDWVRFILRMPKKPRGYAERQAHIFADRLLMPTEYLAPRLELVPGTVRTLYHEAIQEGVRPSIAQRNAWQKWCDLLAHEFKVSRDAMAKRLDHEGSTAETLVL